MKNDTVPVIKDLVLIGGGHSHLSVLKHFAMNPVPGLQITLITRDLHTPYSGMLPGYIAGHYSYDESHIDLRPLSQFAKARIYHSEVSSLDLESKTIKCLDRPPIAFDFVSINIGSRPSTLHVPGANEFAIPVKPIDTFLTQWEQLSERVLEVAELNLTNDSTKSFHLAIVGGGAGGIEMALAAQYRILNLLSQKNLPTNFFQVDIYCETEEILPTHNEKVRTKFLKTLIERGIKVHNKNRINEVQQNIIVGRDNKQYLADATVWVTSASAPMWLAESGLDVDEKGFVTVNNFLQSTSHSSVFAAGDIAASLNHPREKSGVFAVRQGLPLARNLKRAVLNQTLKSFIPQKKFLGLISTGNQYAIASRGSWSVEGEWVWKVKNWIDCRFMENFNSLPEITQMNSHVIDKSMVDKKTHKEISDISMRCGGCGSKVGSTILSRVINKLQPIIRDDIITGLDDPDDAAIIEAPAGKLIVQSVDYLRSFIDDPYIFGQIASNHSLSDIFAMGAQAQSAMAIATIPYGIDHKIEEQLFQIMSGALSILNASNTALIGGHSSEGAELSFGLSVTGLADSEQIIRKSGMQQGDVIILTKALGVGTLFAADMRRKAKGRWIDSAIQNMLISNQQAGGCLQRYDVTACTDITGFGLLGHLVEMCNASGKKVEINLDRIPVLKGALETIELGIFSSLHEQNARHQQAINLLDSKISNNGNEHQHFPLLFDPQTSGGLLATIPANHAEECLKELIGLGYQTCTVIGRVLGDTDSVEKVTLV